MGDLDIPGVLEYRQQTEDLLDDLEEHVRRGALTPHLLTTFIAHWRDQVGAM